MLRLDLENRKKKEKLSAYRRRTTRSAWGARNIRIFGLLFLF